MSNFIELTEEHNGKRVKALINIAHISKVRPELYKNGTVIYMTNVPSIEGIFIEPYEEVCNMIKEALND